MSRRRDNDGDVRSVSREALPPPAPGTKADHATPGYTSLLPGTDSAVGILFGKLCAIRGGYIKVRMDSLGSTNHFTYTWAVGPHKGCYVYARFEYWELESALHTLLRKVLEVEEGRLKPSPDKYST